MSEFEKDGETELLRLSPLEESQRAGDPVIIISAEPEQLIYPKDASQYILISASDIGMKNLAYDGFKFGTADSPEISDLLHEHTPESASPAPDGKLLFEAVRLGNSALTEELLRKKSDPDAGDENGCTALMLAALLGNTALVSSLIRAGANLNIQNRYGDTALIMACRHLDTMEMDIILADELDLNGKRTSLLWDVWHGSADYIDPFKNRSGISSVNRPHACSEKENIVKILISEGTDVNKQNIDGSTALMHAAAGRYNKSLKLLLNAGANANIQDKDGRAAILQALVCGNQDGLKMLIKCTDPALKNKNGESMLNEAIWYGSLETVEAIIENGCSREEISAALNFAANMENENLVRYLLSKKPDINYRHQKTGFTALMNAAIRNNLNLVTFFLSLGADPSIKNDDGLTALDLARKEKHKQITELLEKAVK